jgi:uncharacterized protein (TIGR00369 family)
LDRKRRSFTCRFRLDKRYAGPPGYCHGGIIATILDDAMSKLSKLGGISAATSRLTVEYLRPVPLGQALRVESRETGGRGRRRLRAAEILDRRGRILARSRGVFVRIDPQRVFRALVAPATACKPRRLRRRISRTRCA